MKRLELFGLEGIAEIDTGDSIGALICDGCVRQGIELADDDVLVVAQKVISKAEGRMVRLDEVKPSPRARQLAEELDKDADHSAREIRREIQTRTGKSVGVIISDSFGRAWRVGTVDVAVGVAGMKPVKDERGFIDRHGYQLKAAVAAVADEIASAAELVMGKRDGVPVVIVRGYQLEKKEDGSVQELLRPEAEDLFR